MGTETYKYNDIMFFDHDTFPGSSHNLWNTASVLFLLMPHGQQKTKPFPHNWYQSRMRLSHVNVGGCTDGFWIFGVFTKRKLASQHITPLPGRQVMGVWDSTISGHMSPYPPPCLQDVWQCSRFPVMFSHLSVCFQLSKSFLNVGVKTLGSLDLVYLQKPSLWKDSFPLRN